MKQENLIVDLSCRFAHNIISSAKGLRERMEYDPASQPWRSGTSIGANVEEAQASQSRSDFISKMLIAAKEARETRYWLRLSRDSALLPEAEVSPLITGIEFIFRILTSIVKPDSENR